MITGRCFDVDVILRMNCRGRSKKPLRKVRVSAATNDRLNFTTNRRLAPMRLRFLHSIFSRYILLCRDVKYYHVYYRRGHVLTTFPPNFVADDVCTAFHTSSVYRAPPSFSNISGLEPRPFARGHISSARLLRKFYIDFKKPKPRHDITFGGIDH